MSDRWLFAMLCLSILSLALVAGSVFHAPAPVTFSLRISDWKCARSQTFVAPQPMQVGRFSTTLMTARSRCIEYRMVGH